MQIGAHSLQRRANLQALVNIGDTPLVPFRALSHPGVQIWAKVEWHQAGGSVKARAANQIVRSALQEGRLRKGIALLDASSGNTAIAYATLLKRYQLSTVICLPSNASAKRIEILKNLGAELILTDPGEGTEGAQIIAKGLYAQHPDKYFYADQYSNPANALAHYQGTGPEILAQTHGRVTHLVAGLGTTGTFTGTVRRLKEFNKAVQAIALQPDGPMHGLEGWKHLGTAKTPSIFDPSLEDGRVEISSEEAYEMIEFIQKTEGYLLSPSSAANLVGAQKVARTLHHGFVVTVLPDALDRYDEVSQLIFGKVFS